MEQADRDIDHLEMIVGTIKAIHRHLAKLTKAQFEEESDDIDLLAFRLSQIGEITNRLSPELKQSSPEIPWRAIAGMRNLIVHEYRRVVPGRLWDTAVSELEALHSFCESELKRL